MYANAYEPTSCAVLSLAVLIMCSDGRDPESVALFSGTNSKDRFSHILSVIVFNMSDDELAILGCERSDIAPYSSRKGAATYASGQVSGPTPVSVQLRMGHTLGKVNDPYIHLSDPADQLCGRTLSLLPIIDERFGTLPPHFNKEALKTLTVEFMTQVMPGYSTFPIEFKPVLSYLLASVIYHEEFLRRELHPQHPLWNSRLYTSNVDICFLRANIIVGKFSCDSTGMQATGVPPHVVQDGKLRAMSDRIEQLERLLVKQHEESMQKLPTAIADSVVSDIRNNLVINGAVPVTPGDIKNLCAELRQAFTQEINSVIAATNANSNINNVTIGGGESDIWWESFDWHDGLMSHAVPKSWNFPSRLPVKRMWDLWHFGHRGDRIRPYKYISRKHDITIHGQKKLYSAAKSVVDRICSIVIATPAAMPPNKTRISELSYAESENAFNIAYKILLQSTYNDVTARIEDVSYATIYNRICDLNKSLE